ncbi:replication-associated recombination protein A [Bacteroidota bacterium]
MDIIKNIPHIPLADRIRPKTIKEFSGQNKLLGMNGPIRKMIDSNNLSSLILWGPPGCGKTTIARLLSNLINAEFFTLNAVSSGVKDLRNIIEKAIINLKKLKRTILFIDEIHRFNKAQQDALLSPVESGNIILIGATTENPSFEIIPPLRSRMRVYVLDKLNADDLNKIMDRAINDDKFLKNLNIKEIDKNYLFYVSGGDARNLLNILEASVLHEMDRNEINISKELIDIIIQKKNIIYDKSGEEHFNLISAFIKSIRGSDPDASLYWMARMIEGGEDPLYIARRLIILASEDIGNASPNALVLAETTFNAVHKIGLPEARIILAQCVTFLASCPKSNAAYTAIEKAFQDVRQKPLYSVPLNLRNAPTDLMKEIGYSRDYKYPHNFSKHFVEENYFPQELGSRQYYFPTSNGQEKKLLDRLSSLWSSLKKY